MADNTDITTFKIQKRETIKPCSPTPQRLRIVNLSLLDQVSPDVYVPLVLFYPFISNTSRPQGPIEIASERVQRLRETLSKTLAHFYPFAGRLRDNRLIECNDEGAEFVEARAAFSMSKILECPNNDTLKKLVVARPESSQGSLGGCILLVQATIFGCGGIALGSLFSHKIADACSVAEFIKTWARASHDDNDNEALVSKPDFVTASAILPPILDSSCKGVFTLAFVQDMCVTRRYVFTAEKIAALKSEAASKDHVKNPTRVESVSGLLWKCVIKSSASRSATRTSFWSQALNVRKRVVPPLGQTVIGNLAMLFTAKADDQDDIELRALVGKFRRGLEEEAEHYAKKGYIVGIVGRRFEEFADRMNSNEIKMFGCSSWCRFGLYEADLGWGKPAWMSMVSWECKNTIVLMDTRDGDGIEAWLSVSEQDMAHIENDQEFLRYASLNPSVVV